MNGKVDAIVNTYNVWDDARQYEQGTRGYCRLTGQSLDRGYHRTLTAVTPNEVENWKAADREPQNTELVFVAMIALLSREHVLKRRDYEPGNPTKHYTGSPNDG